jgi:phage shock protein PspC (stress-responsive transcriptional regulator)
MARRTTASAPPPDEAADASDQTPDGAADATTTTATAAPETAAASDTPGSDTAGDGATAARPTESGFFSWLRGLGLQRRSGWLGGVCGGIATRLGLDPLLVRGIVVVLAVVGAPVALLYAAAWFLLPDEAGTIHAQELGRGRVTRALPGIVAVFLLSFLPLTQGFWYAGALYWGDLGWGGAAGRIVWTAVLLVAVIVLVVWLARRSSTEIPTTPATTDDRPETVPSFPADTAGAAAASPAAGADAGLGTGASLAAAAPASAALAEPTAPPAPPAEASAEELAAWKASQDEWQRQRAAWAAEQRRSERDRRQAEAQAQAVEAARLARERARIRRLTRPRASAGIVFLVLGVALVSGAISAFAASQSSATRGAEWMIGAAVLVLALGVGTVAVALGRRRSGALAFFSILAMLALVGSLFVPTDRQLLAPWVTTWVDSTHSGSYAQLAGTVYVNVYPTGAADPAVIDVWQLSGYTNIQLDEGTTVRLEVQADEPGYFVEVSELWADGGSSSSYRVGRDGLTLLVGEGDPDVVLRLHSLHGTHLWINAESWERRVPLTPASGDVATWQTDENGVGTIVPEPTPIPTDPADAGTTTGGGGTP